MNHELFIWVGLKKLFLIVQYLWDLCTSKFGILQYIKKFVAPKSVLSTTKFCLVQQKEARVVGKLIYVFLEMPILPLSNHSCIEQTQSSVFMG